MLLKKKRLNWEQQGMTATLCHAHLFIQQTLMSINVSQPSVEHFSCLTVKGEFFFQWHILESQLHQVNKYDSPPHPIWVEALSLEVVKDERTWPQLESRRTASNMINIYNQSRGLVPTVVSDQMQAQSHYRSMKNFCYFCDGWSTPGGAQDFLLAQCLVITPVVAQETICIASNLVRVSHVQGTRLNPCTISLTHGGTFFRTEM